MVLRNAAQIDGCELGRGHAWCAKNTGVDWTPPPAGASTLMKKPDSGEAVLSWCCLFLTSFICFSGTMKATLCALQLHISEGPQRSQDLLSMMPTEILLKGAGVVQASSGKVDSWCEV
jgi:hypothetical protein